MAALVVGFVVPVGAYATWYHQERGRLRAVGVHRARALPALHVVRGLRASSSVPAYQRVLCPAEPLGQRRDPTYYVFHDSRTLPRLQPPAGTTQDEALRDFAFAAVRAQPLDYAGIVARDFWLNFSTPREDAYEYDTAHKWRFDEYLTVRADGVDPVRRTTRTAAGSCEVRQPFADAVVTLRPAYAYLPGPAAARVPAARRLLGGLGVGRARRSGLRTVTWVLLLSGVGLLLGTGRHRAVRLALPAPRAGAAAGRRGLAYALAAPSTGTDATASTD